MSTGNVMIDQFQPWFFGVAFAFLFKYCTGMPDIPEYFEKERYRRDEDAPRIEGPLWVRVMARRVEAQLSRDWHFGFVTWNYLFRSSVNLSRSFFSYERGTGESGRAITAEELGTGAIEICKALWGKYTDLDGRSKNVGGDMTKVRYTPGLSAAAKRLLQNVEHTSRKIAGTQETRRQMRFDTNANRIRYGVPIFVTFTPDEAHNCLMLRLSRCRQNDPVFADGRDEVGKRVAQRREPPLGQDFTDDVFLRVPIADLQQWLPDYDERQTILARDALASVDGFRVACSVTYEYLWGMRVCAFCPDCNNGAASTPCQDIFGSNATPEGGSLGRLDAGYTSIEAQKSKGSLHAHSQLFVQCLHQHTPLIEVLRQIKGSGGDVVSKYLQYKAHVCKQTYEDVASARACQTDIEKDWPEYKTSTVLLSRPGYQSRRDDATFYDANYVVES